MKQKQSIIAFSIALISVLVTMVVYYRLAGLIASIAVMFNVLIILASMKIIGASLTLASITGIILTIGMAVDANVLVFERIREEFSRIKSVPQAIRFGYQRALSAILDANITTLAIALILVAFAVGPIRGFAVTMGIGILSSMFTALFVTKIFLYKYMSSSKTLC